MHARLFPIVLSLALLFSALGFGPAAQAATARPASSKGVSPAGLLNPDGTLRLDGSFSGALDLSGWGVRLDPQRGPVFG